ncbi:ABC transporter substrate-binding protein [Bacillus horti]|uniref:Iron complex transport system substrate-binding protein n=1 Tax=Caldalkalibacillus horti TaxID=77523 RepID=A0ABT9VVJ7_9BACI|nr:iron-siderophore ABC transporter substrate-binding protein [Bacillus horti]MDQ0165022.1 iron complex transport system substrate-binding protein [Bacillus horti]
MNKKLWLLALCLTCLFVLAACSQQAEEAPETEAPAQDATSEEEQTEQSETADASRSIEHVLGETTLDQPAQKIVALEWTYAENLLALGVKPTGVSDIEGYNTWVPGDTIPDDVVDVGTRQEPNLEVIGQLQPDLIIAAKSRHEGIKDQLELIAPTIFFDSYPADEEFDQYQEMVETFEKIAVAVDKEDQAKQVLQDLEQVYADAKEQLSEANLSTDEFVITQAFSAAQTPTLRLFTPNSMVSVILEKIGLSNAYESEAFEIYGFTQTGIEALPALEDSNFIYIVQEDDNIFENQLSGNAVWTNLAFVQEDRLYALPGDTWTFGGPSSAKTLVEQVVQTMVNNE